MLRNLYIKWLSWIINYCDTKSHRAYQDMIYYDNIAEQAFQSNEIGCFVMNNRLAGEATRKYEKYLYRKDRAESLLRKISK